MIFDALMRYPSDAPPWVIDHTPIAVEVDGHELAAHHVADRTARIASVLRAGGVAPGDRCVVWLESPTDITVCYIALTAIDAVPILVHPGLPASTVAAMVEDVRGVSAIVTADDRIAAATDALSGIEVVDWRDIAAVAPGHPRLTRPPQVGTEAPYIVVHTSGTTSVPKLLECSGRSVEASATVQARMHRFARLKGYLAVQVSPVHGRTVVGVYAALKRRAPVMFLQHDAPDRVRELLTTYRPEFLETHPNTFRAWQHLAQEGVFSSIRFFGSGFDTIHPDTVQAVLSGSRRRFPFYVDVYGMNEAGPVSIKIYFRKRRRGPSALAGVGRHDVGVQFPVCRVRILDELGRRVRPGEAGRIVVKTAGVHSGYINRPDMVSRDYPRGRWWDTGDWGRKARFGTLTLVDRGVDMVTLGSSAIAMEDALLARFPELLELVILEHDGELVPIGSLRPGCLVDDERWAAATQDLPHVGRLRVIPDVEIPRTATGKVRRLELRSRLDDLPAPQGVS